jgi:hypothetical protein
MEQNALRKSLWNTASIAGLALGGVSILYLVWSQLITNGNVHTEPTTTIKVFSFLVWALKLVGCVLLMKFFMKKFFNGTPGLDRSHVFKMGMATAFLSALVYATAYLVNMLYISPEYFNEVYSVALTDMEKYMDQNAKANINDIINSLPKIMFFWNLLYCFIFGTILSALLSRSFPKRNPFQELM